MQKQLRPEHLAQLEHEWDIKSVDWPLDSSSVVVEVGAYKGRWAAIMCDLYKCKIYAFEPQLWAWGEAAKSLNECDGMRLCSYGLGDRDGSFEMGDFETDGCSFVKLGNDYKSAKGQMRETAGRFRKLGLTHIDVMLINIEGYEYTLLPHMARVGLMPTVDNLMVQFHNFATDEKKHSDLLALIGQTHRVLWDYGTMLTAWTRIDD